MRSFKHSTQFTVIFLSLISHAWTQAELPAPGCSTVSLLANLCNFQSTNSHHTALHPSQLTCVCYNSQSSYIPDAWDNAVDSCYQYMTNNIATLTTEDLFSINGGTAYPALWSEVFGGLCTKYASAPATNVATTSVASFGTNAVVVATGLTTSPSVTSVPTSSSSVSQSGAAVATTTTAEAALRGSPMNGVSPVFLLGLALVLVVY